MWQAFHERDGWASTTKTHRNVAFVVVTFIILLLTWRASIPALMPELLGIYLTLAVAGRGMDRWIEQKKDKPNVDDGSGTR
jgi:hypothetical protein